MESDLDAAAGLMRRALRARVWHRLEAGHRATLRVVSWVLEKGDEGFVSRVRRNGAIRRMVLRAVKGVLELVRAVPNALPFLPRALKEGARIAEERIRAYAAHGVFRWAPWVQGWLRQRDVLLYLGAAFLDSGPARRL